MDIRTLRLSPGLRHGKALSGILTLAVPVVGVLLLLAGCSGAGPSPTTTGSELMDSLSGKRLLFLGAHPDDEWVLMPIFAEACLFRGATCHFVSTTRAELGCFGSMRLTDLDACADLRAREFAASAAVAGGTAELLGWEDLFYAHDGEGLRRNLERWDAVHGGRRALVQSLVDLLQRNRTDVVFGLDPRHGSTCHPNHRATSLLLAEAIEEMPSDTRPRVLLESTITTYEAMSEEMVAATDRGAMFPWPDQDNPIQWFDGTRVLPNGRRAIDYQIDALLAHRTQFPELTEDATIDAGPEQLRIPLVDLRDIDPTEELCSPLDLSMYKTSDVTLEYIGFTMQTLAEQSDSEIAFRLSHHGEVIAAHGQLSSAPHRVERSFPAKSVLLEVASGTETGADQALARLVRHLEGFINAPD